MRFLALSWIAMSACVISIKASHVPALGTSAGSSGGDTSTSGGASSGTGGDGSSSGVSAGSTGSSTGGGATSGGGSTSSSTSTTGGPIDPGLPARYPEGVLHSPLTPTVIAKMNAILASGTRDLKRFTKAGNANCGIEFSPFQQPNCFGWTTLPSNWATTNNYQSAVTYFSSDPITDPQKSYCPSPYCGGPSYCENANTSFGRLSTACSDSSEYDLSLLNSEQQITNGAFALVEYGMAGFSLNNASWNDEWVIVSGFAQFMFSAIDTVIAGGVVPLVREVPAQVACSNYDNYQCSVGGSLVGCTVANCTSPYLTPIGPLHASVLRGLAESRQIPFADVNVQLQQANAPITSYYGGPGGDPTNGHLYQPNNNGNTPADFTQLQFGYPADVLTSMQQLSRAWQLTQGTLVAEANPGPARTGSGTAADPFIIAPVSFTDVGNLTSDAAPPFTNFSACGGGTEDGPAAFYRIDVAADTPVRVLLTSPTNSPASSMILRHFTGSVAIANCQAPEESLASYYRITLTAGTHYFAVLTPKLTANGHAPEYLFVVEPCAPADTLCQ